MTRVKEIYQAEIAECGIVCVAMVADYFSYSTSIDKIKLSFPSSIRGNNSYQICEILNCLNIESRVLRLEIEDLHEFRHPVIIHWSLSHFVVLERINHKRAVIVDPSSGRREVSIEDFSNMFSGIAIECWPGADFKELKEGSNSGLRDIVFRDSSNIKALLLIISIAIIEQILSVSIPLSLKYFSDFIAFTKNSQLIAPTAFILFIICLLSFLLSLYRTEITLKFGASVFFKFSSSISNKLFKIPLDFFYKNESTSIVDKISSLTNLRTVLSENITFLFIDFCALFVLLVVLFIFSPVIFIICFFGIFINFSMQFYTLPKLKSNSLKAIESWSNWRSMAEESVRCMTQYRVSGNYFNQSKRLNNRLSKSTMATIKDEYFKFKLNSVHTMIANIQLLIIISYSTHLLISEVITVGSLLAIIATIGLVNARVSSLSMHFFSIKESSIFLTRIASIRSQPVGSNYTFSNTSDIAIEFQNLYFKYPGASEYLIEDLNFCVSKGSSIGLYGPSGKGKSTLVKLILGLESPTRGKILLNGNKVPKDSINMSDLDVMAILQTDSLLNGSIGDNISFFDEHLDVNRIVECAKLVGLHEQIATMPMRYETLVGPNISSLSAGQVQRVLLARSLYLNKNILILDEATANLDIESERAVINMLKNAGKTLFIISHRPETLQGLDLLVEFSKSSLKVINDE